MTPLKAWLLTLLWMERIPQELPIAEFRRRLIELRKAEMGADDLPLPRSGETGPVGAHK